MKRLVTRARTRLAELPHLLERPRVGSAAWLVRTEVAYGGLVTGVARRKVSPHDSRSPAELAVGGMIGGDRMLHHGYAPAYARHLAPFLSADGLVLAEFGILEGSGLAIWCDLFPDARILGFYIDLTHFERNRPTLLRRGAFKRNQPQLHEYDQLVDGTRSLADALRGDTLDVVIDDGLHTLDAILTTWRSVRPHLSPRFVYFIEDYHGLLDQCGNEFSGLDCTTSGMLTVISSGVPAGAEQREPRGADASPGSQ